jgi:RNA polymerase II subunit A small phosphatase-like protein
LEASDGNKLLVLDLDETLIHSKCFSFEESYDFSIGHKFSVVKRPGLDQFLETCFENFDVAFWTSSGQDYADKLLTFILKEGQKPKFVWDSRRCTRYLSSSSVDSVDLKKLSKVFRMKIWGKDDVLIVDDSKEKASKNYGNLIQCSPFYGDLNDAELPELERYLMEIKDFSHLRRLDKRNWNNKD